MGPEPFGWPYTIILAVIVAGAFVCWCRGLPRENLSTGDEKYMATEMQTKKVSRYCDVINTSRGEIRIEWASDVPDGLIDHFFMILNASLDEHAPWLRTSATVYERNPEHERIVAKNDHVVVRCIKFPRRCIQIEVDGSKVFDDYLNDASLDQLWKSATS